MLRRLSPRWLTAAATGLLPVTWYFVAATAPAVAAAPADGSLSLRVESARTVGPAPEIQKGDPITAYHWMVTSDDVGNPHDAVENCLPSRAGVTSPADFADHCAWPSVRAAPAAVPIVAQGDQTDLSADKTLDKLPVGNT